MTRGKSFTRDQDVALCNARLNTIQEPFNVVSQPPYNFWDRVYQNYIELTGDQNVRSQHSVKCRWKLIFSSCNKFHNCLTQIEKHSGLTESEKVLQANKLYVQLEKKRFAMTHCWVILQHKVKWKDLTMRKRSNRHTMVTTPDVVSSPKRSDPHTMATNPDQHSSPNRSDPHTMATNPNIDSFSSQSQESDTLISVETNKDPNYTAEIQKKKRPTCKRSKVVHMDSRFCDLLEQFTKQLAQTDERKVKIAERKVKVMEEMNEREQREHDDRIMSMDTSIMEPCARAYYEQRKNDIYVRTMACRKDTSNVDPHTAP